MGWGVGGGGGGGGGTFSLIGVLKMATFTRRRNGPNIYVYITERENLAVLNYLAGKFRNRKVILSVK